MCVATSKRGLNMRKSATVEDQVRVRPTSNGTIGRTRGTRLVGVNSEHAEDGGICVRKVRTGEAARVGRTNQCDQPRWSQRSRTCTSASDSLLVCQKVVAHLKRSYFCFHPESAAAQQRTKGENERKERSFRAMRRRRKASALASKTRTFP